jgi:dynein heavy chain 2
MPQVKVMCSKVESEVQAFAQELDKFSARWHQLKPQDNLNVDKDSAANALASLKERRAKFNEFLQTSKKLQIVNILVWRD